jgi:ribosomal protein S18 acetylase RimI-like enzyme
MRTSIIGSKIAPLLARSIILLLSELRPGKPELSLKFLQKIRDQKNLKIFVAKEGREILGMAILRWHDLPVGRVGKIEDVVVSSARRGNGVGSRLIEDMIKFAKKNKVSYIDLTSKPERVVANKLYQKMGWKKRETNCYRLVL